MKRSLLSVSLTLFLIMAGAVGFAQAVTSNINVPTAAGQAAMVCTGDLICASSTAVAVAVVAVAAVAVAAAGFLL